MVCSACSRLPSEAPRSSSAEITCAGGGAIERHRAHSEAMKTHTPGVPRRKSGVSRRESGAPRQCEAAHLHKGEVARGGELRSKGAAAAAGGSGDEQPTHAAVAALRSRRARRATAAAFAATAAAAATSAAAAASRRLLRRRREGCRQSQRRAPRVIEGIRVAEELASKLAELLAREATRLAHLWGMPRGSGEGALDGRGAAGEGAQAKRAGEAGGRKESGARLCKG